ncbi:MAG: secretin N-terminal domain-containing protein [Opitutales bacterium]|jgi:type IV pilus assembly protein PilQ
MKVFPASAVLLFAATSWLAAQNATPASNTTSSSAPTAAPTAAPAPTAPPPLPVPSSGTAPLPPLPAPADLNPPAPAPAPAPAPTPSPSSENAVQVIAPANVTVQPTTVTTTSDVFAPTNKGSDQVQQVTTETPALDIKFPTGNATVQYPTQETASTTAAQQDETISVDFPNEEIRTILRNVADMYDLNLVIPETLTGTTSVKLRNVTWEQVFSVVLDPVGFTYVVDNNIVKVRSRQEVATEPVETRVFLINSAKAADLMTSLTPLVDTAAGGRIQVDNRTNALIITERPTHMNNIQEIIDRLDRPTQQVSIEAKFIELQKENDTDLGVTWNFNGTNLGSVGYAWQYNIAHGLGVIGDSGALPLRQVPISANGVQSGLNGVIPSGTTYTYQPPRRAADLAVFNQAEYDATLQAMQTITNARLVSDPTVVTLDNEEVSFLVGTQIILVYPTINNQTGQASPGEHEKLNVGITMRVRPQVTNNGFINLTVNPIVSRLDAVSDTYFGGTYPRVDTRELTDAKVSIKDGYTLALGGLIDDTDQKVTTQVPVLGDLPVLGYLFRSTSTTIQHNNLIIFITAKTLNPDGATYREVIDPNLLIRTDVTNNEIPGFYDRSHPEVPGMVRVSDQQVQAMQQVQAARDQAEYNKQMVQYKADQKDAVQAEAQHLGK